MPRRPSPSGGGDPDASALYHRAAGKRLLEEGSALEKAARFKDALSRYREAAGHIRDSDLDKSIKKLEGVLGESFKMALIRLLEPQDGARVRTNSLTIRGRVLGGKMKEVEALGAKIPVEPDGTFLRTLNLTKEGEITIEVRGKTEGGVFARPALAVITVDYTAPKITLLSPSRGLHTNADKLWIEGEVDDEKASISIGGIPAYLDGKKWKILKSFSGEGKQTITAIALDPMGNRSEAGVDIIIDRTPPKIQLQKPGEGEECEKDTLLIIGLTEDSMSPFKVYVQGTEVICQSGLFKKSVPLSDGENTVAIKAVDSAGNEAVVSRKVVGVLSCPSPLIESPSAGFKTPQNKITVICSFTRAVQNVWIGGLVARSLSGNKWSKEVNLTLGKNTITVFARDKWGRKSRSSVEVERFEEQKDDPYEPNNTLSEAHAISAGSLSGILKKGDTDWYRVNIDSASAIIARLSFTHSKGDLELGLYDSSGAELDKSTGSGDTEKVKKDISSEPVYIKVYGSSGAGNSYMLRVGVEKKASPSSSLSGFTYLRTTTYSAGGQTNTVKEYRHDKTGLEFVLVPGGSYTIGSKQVRLSPYLISKTEVTQSVWKKVMETEPWSGKSYVKEGSDYPATYVNWNDAKSLCKKAGLRLPTEVEWEVACRAGTTTTYYWGNNMDGDYAWYDKNAWDIGEKYAHEVVQKKPNAFGLYDMSGNVWEWCEDWYSSNYPSGTDNPKGAFSGSGRVHRGGCFLSRADLCASGYRYYFAPGHRDYHLGFRVVWCWR